ncbi:hypothetical protein LCGC14_0829810 [marine sediment metagenome]|uniref:Uncharacterized protein n=1 Tax=marine sediment metagenome TaxID=412755 RepID=A0A0F9S145_9ZZZZ
MKVDKVIYFYLFCYLYMGFFWERICQIADIAQEQRHSYCKCFFNVLLWPVGFGYGLLSYVIGIINVRI